MARKRHTATRLTILSTVFLLRALAQDRYLVRVDPAKIGEVAARHGMHVVRALEGSAQGLYVVETFRQRRGVSSRDELMGDVRQVTSDPQVKGIEPDGLISLPELASTQTAAPGNFQMPDKTPTNYFQSTVWSGYVNQAAAAIVKNAQAHNVATGSGTVAILDTGADFGHAGFGNSLVQGYDFVHNRSGGSDLSDLDQSTTSILDQSTTSILDRNTILALNQSTTSILDSRTAIAFNQKRPPAAFGHGTMVAGLIHLVAPNAKLMPVKVFGDDGSATLSRIVQGIYWAIDHNANVINMSFSSDVPSIELMLAINYANLRRVICVAAAGNDGKQTLVYPAGFHQVMGVGSTNDQDVRSTFSNYGDALVSLAAPGEGLVTFYPGNNYAAGWGTSFSTPLVAGGAALLVQMSSGSINESQASRALSEAADVGQGLGAGRLDLVLATGYGNKYGYNR